MMTTDTWSDIQELLNDPAYQEPNWVVARSLVEAQALAAWIDDFEAENDGLTNQT